MGRGVGLGGIVGEGVGVGTGVQVGGSSDIAVARGGDSVADNCGSSPEGCKNPQLLPIRTMRVVIRNIEYLFIFFTLE